MDIVHKFIFQVHNLFQENEPENEGVSSWDCVWSQKLAAKPKFMASSPDGAYFATCGVSDCLVKIWFQREGRLYRSVVLYLCLNSRFCVLWCSHCRGRNN